jgi:tetratricopeptide (TPR) repeat protein
MSIEISPSPSQPKPTIKLWTPNTIGALTFFLGFPAGITLATINWIKMGMTKKIIPHILIGIAGIVALIFLPDNIGRIVGLALSWGYIAFFRQQMKSDIEKLDRFDVQNARWYSGFFMGVGLYGIVFIAVMAFIFIQSIYESITPGHALYYSNRGDNYLSSGNYDLAIVEYTKAIDLDPALASLYYNRGLAYSIEEKYDLAIDDYTKSIEIDPEYADTYNNRCRIYYLLGKYEKALPDCEKALSLAPNTDYMLDLRASIYVALDRKEEAIKDFEHILEFSSNQEFINHAKEELKRLNGR